MRVLWLACESNKDAFYGFTERLGQLCSLTTRWLSTAGAKHVVKAVGAKEIKQFDRVVIHLPFELLVKQSAYIRCIPNLVLLQTDLSMAVVENASNLDKFSRLLKIMPWVRVLTNAGEGQAFLASLGVDQARVPLGFNAAWYRDSDEAAIYSAGIFADLDNPDIKARRHMLFDIKTQNRLQFHDEVQGKILAQQLKQMDIVICNDMGCGQYRHLNFKTQACGVALMTWDRGDQENQAVGFVDMVNVMLYKDAKSAQAKLNFLKRHPEQLASIKEAGKTMAIECHSNRALADKLVDFLRKPLKPFTGDDVEDAMRFRFFR